MKIQKKPYEISLWTTTSDSEGNLIEKKLGVIGSAEMEDSPFRTFEPHLIENINGSKTLTFSIFWRWYNPETQEFESNPWEKYLVNERRIKLRYDENWYEFVIKEVEESKEEYKKTFTCVSAPILELSRNGYNVELDDTLYNSQGTAIELAQRILDGSDWVVDEDNSDKIYSFYTEHLYRAVATDNVTVTDIKEGTTISIPQNANVYFFYSEIENEKSPVQLLYNWDHLKDSEGQDILDGNWPLPANVDSNNVIINEPIYLYEGPISSFDIEEIDLTYKCARLVLSQLGHYDPILKAFVKDYEDNSGNRKYGYIKTEYITSDVIGNLINNPKDYTLTRSQETLSAWGTYVQNWYPSNGASLNQTTYPGLTDLGDIEAGTKINLETDPNNIMTGLMLWKIPTKDTYIYNTSTKENLVFLPNGIIRGSKYVFRIKCCLIKSSNLKVSGYMSVPNAPPSNKKIWEPLPNPNNICCGLYLHGKPILTFKTNNIEGHPQEFERVEGINGVSIPVDEGWYKYENNAFEPATANDGIYDGTKQYYKSVEDRTKLPYYYGIATADTEYSKEDLNNTTLEVRISTEQNLPKNTYLIVQDVELFQYYADEKCEPLMYTDEKFFCPPGSPLISDIKQTLKIYDPAENSTAKNETEYKWEAEFTDLENIEPYKPINNDYLAINSITGAQSNYYNLLQEVCETFQCWADFKIEYKNENPGEQDIKEHYYKSPDIVVDPAATYYLRVEDEGEVFYNIIDFELTEYHNPQAEGWYEMKKTAKKAVLKNYIGKENYAGFRYGINLSGISRSIDSNEFVSKMIVAGNQTEGAKNGICTIERAEDNPTGTTSVYDFTYYINQQLLDEDALNKDLYIEDENSIGFYPQMKALTQRHLELLDQWNLWTNQWITQGGRKQVAESESQAAREQQIFAFEDLCTFIRDDSGYMYQGYGTLDPSSADAYDRVVKFVNTYWDQDPEHNSTIEFWIKYVNASYILDSSLKELEDATNAYNKADSEIKEIQKELTDIEARITILQKEFFSKYNNFIQEGTWNDADALDDDLYYYDAAQVLKVSAQPRVSYQISVIELSELEGYEPYTFAIGDKTYIEDTEFFGWTSNGSPYREEVVVNEINWSLDEPENNQIVVQNYRTQFEDLFQRLSASVQQAELNANAYNRAAQIVQPSGKIDQSALQKSFELDRDRIEMSFGTGSITQNREGIIIEGLGKDRKDKLKITGKGIFITADNGTTWTPIMRGSGANAATLTSGSLDVSNINIIDGNFPSFQWNGDGLTAYGFKDIAYQKYEPTSDSFDPSEEDLWELGQLKQIEIASIDIVIPEEEEENNGN